MELLVVADPADRLASEVVQIAREHGHTAFIFNVCEAARLFSIHIDSGQASIEPDLPLFLRMPSQPVLRTSFDASFQYGECLATLWAAAALSKSPVINRAGVNGLLGRASYSSALTELRAGVTGGATEVFSRDVPSPPEPGKQQWYIQDTITYRTTAWPTIPEGTGPYRARWADPDPAYEVVVVLGHQAWRCTIVPLDHLELQQKSIFVIQKLGLNFGAVTWSISPDLKCATLVRVNPFPSMGEVQFVWLGLGPALMKEFFP